MSPFLGLFPCFQQITMNLQKVAKLLKKIAQSGHPKPNLNETQLLSTFLGISHRKRPPKFRFRPKSDSRSFPEFAPKPERWIRVVSTTPTRSSSRRWRRNIFRVFSGAKFSTNIWQVELLFYECRKNVLRLKL